MMTTFMLLKTEKQNVFVEVKWKEADTLIVIHIEPQSYWQQDFNDRMFKYFSLLHNKVKRPIISIAIFTNNESLVKNECTIRFSDFEV